MVLARACAYALYALAVFLRYNFLDDEGMDEITARGIMKQLLEATALFNPPRYCVGSGFIQRDHGCVQERNPKRTEIAGKGRRGCAR